MFGQAPRRAGVNIAEQANLQRNPFIKNVLRKVAQLHRSAVRDGNVVNQSSTVPDPMRSAVLNCLPNRFLSESFAGMNRDIEILPLNIVKSVYVLLGWIPALLARKVESHYAPVAEINSEFRRLE